MNSEWKSWVEDILEAMGSVVIVDKSCQVVYITDVYSKMFNLNREEAIGQKISDLVPGELLSAVVQTGKEDKSCLYSHDGHTMLVNRMTIKKNGKIIGGLAFNASSLHSTDKQLEEKLAFTSKQLLFYREKLKKDMGTKYNIEEIITRNDEMLQLIEMTKRIARSRSNVLIFGDSGTGKELFSHSIHNLSERARMPFIALNCAAIPENLMESELFGYADGAFTGASKGGKKGRIEMADGGTLLLDEINSMPLHLQAKLLRVVQEKEVQVIGDSTRKVDVRFVFTTNEDLGDLVKKGLFRSDLYYRINVVELRVPALRDRKEDIEPLTYHLINKLNDELGLCINGISDNAIQLLLQYDWPGNVRELGNMVERAMDLAGSGKLQVEHFDRLSKKMGELTAGMHSLRAAREEAERLAIIKTLRLVRGNKKKAAELLEIDRSILYDKLKKYQIRL